MNDYKNSKAYSYHKSGWLQPLLYHNLTGSNFCILKGECRKSQSVNDPFHNLWIILEKSAKIWSYHGTCMAGMGETCNHVAAAMFQVEVAVHTGLTNPCIEIKCPYSINYTEPNEQNLDYLYIDGDAVKLKHFIISISRNALCKWGLQKPKLLILWFRLHME